jgi:hypothetical protein
MFLEALRCADSMRPATYRTVLTKTAVVTLEACP